MLFFKIFSRDLIKFPKICFLLLYTNASNTTSIFQSPLPASKPIWNIKHMRVAICVTKSNCTFERLHNLIIFLVQPKSISVSLCSGWRISKHCANPTEGKYWMCVPHPNSFPATPSDNQMSTLLREGGGWPAQGVPRL